MTGPWGDEPKIPEIPVAMVLIALAVVFAFAGGALMVFGVGN